jgi:4-amino-4-deoxy-L-arabinose transferase-like glycosyltransferase
MGFRFSWDDSKALGWVLASRFRVILFLGVCGLGLLGAGTWSLPLIDRDEPRFAGATREMVAAGEWVIPYFNGEYRFDKPVLIYWLMRIGIFIFGDHEWGVRFPSIFFAVGTAWLIYEIGRTLRRPGTGLLGGCLWLTLLQVLLHGRLAVADMPMVFFLTLVQWALLHLVVVEGSWKRFGVWFWLLWLGLGMGFLAKGPIALAVPLGTLLLWRWLFWRGPVVWSKLQAGWGVVVMLAVMGSWGIPALIMTDGLFWKVGMGEHVIERGTEAFNNRSFLFFFYFLVAPLSLLPWFGLAGYVWQSLRRVWDGETAFLAAWVVVPYVIFSIYSTQLPHYVMPAFPAMALLFAMGVVRVWELPEEEMKWSHGWFWVFSFVLPLVVMVGGLAAMVLAQGEQEPEMAWVFMGLAGAMVGLAMLAMAARFQIFGLAVVSAVVLIVCQVIIGKKLSEFVPSRTLASYDLRDGGVARGYQEPSLIYYGGPGWRWLPESQAWGEFLEAASGVPVAVALVEERRLEDWAASIAPTLIRARERAAHLPEDWEQLAKERGFLLERKRGLNLARMSWVEVVFLRRLAEGDLIPDPSGDAPPDRE